MPSIPVQPGLCPSVERADEDPGPSSLLPVQLGGREVGIHEHDTEELTHRESDSAAECDVDVHIGRIIDGPPCAPRRWGHIGHQCPDGVFVVSLDFPVIASECRPVDRVEQQPAMDVDRSGHVVPAEKVGPIVLPVQAALGVLVGGEADQPPIGLSARALAKHDPIVEGSGRGGH